MYEHWFDDINGSKFDKLPFVCLVYEFKPKFSFNLNKKHTHRISQFCCPRLDKEKNLLSVKLEPFLLSCYD